MNDRQQQLIAAAQAMQTWIHAQRATWAAAGSLTSLRGEPQLATASATAASVAAAIVPSSVLGVPEPAASAPWAESESTRAPLEGLRSAVQGTSSFVRSSWPMLAGIAVLVVAVGVARVAWPTIKAKMSSNLAAGREVVESQAEALSQKVGTDRPTTGAPAVPAMAAVTGRLRVESSPSGARVSIDGKDRGVTPITIEGLASGSHKVVVRGDDGLVQRTVSITPGELAQLSESIYSGWLHVSAPFEVQLSEGPRSITLDDSNQVLLAPGPHDVRFENRLFGLREVRHLDIRPGETTAVSLALPTSRLTVTSSEPATVSIDGQRVGETPLTEYAVPVGTRDVTVTNASGQVRHQTITVKVEPAKLDFDFARP